MSSETLPYGWLDLVWLVFLTVVGIMLSAILATSVFDLSVFLSGLLSYSQIWWMSGLNQAASFC